MTFSLTSFGLPEMLHCGTELRGGAVRGATMEEVAGRVVRYFYDGCRGADGGRECVLVRFYKLHPYADLQPASRELALKALGGGAAPAGMQTLTLMATVGDEPEWNSRWKSEAHHSIPLPSVEFVHASPMVAQLVRSMGLDLEDVVRPRPEVFRGMQGKTHNVFYVPVATSCEYIPAQPFVHRYGVRSVLGFGGVLLTGEFYAVVLFSRVEIPPETADRFRNTALDLKLAIFGAGVQATFREPNPAPVSIEHSV